MFMDPGISAWSPKNIRTNYTQISALTRWNPVAITVNGWEDTVRISHVDYLDRLHYIGEINNQEN